MKKDEEGKSIVQTLISLVVCDSAAVLLRFNTMKGSESVNGLKSTDFTTLL